MKKQLLPVLALMLLVACQKENTNDLVSGEEVYETGSATNRGSNKRNVCHNGNIININVNAIPAHQAHGDAVDMDEDGYFNIENVCGPTDCDDSNPELTDNCFTGCVEGELEVTLPGGNTIYVHPVDQNTGDPNGTSIPWGGIGLDMPGLTNYTPGQTPAATEDFDGVGNTNKIYTELTINQNVTYNYAAKRCKELTVETGCDWYLPALGELKAVYEQYGNTPEKRIANNFNGAYYWSSTEESAYFGWVQNFEFGNRGGGLKNLNTPSCRCVRN